MMSNLNQPCDVCGQAVVSWPAVVTILGTMDLCGVCYWRYREIMDEMVAFVNAEVGCHC